MASRCKLLFLTVMPSPYQRQLFNALAADLGLDINVLYYAAGTSDRSWKMPELTSFERVLPGKVLHLLGPSAHFNPGIVNELRHTGDSLVVVSDYSALTAQLAMWFLTLTRRPWVYWGEMPGMREGRLRGLVRSLLMLPVRLGADAVCAIGEIAVQRYRAAIGTDIPIFNIPYFCDLQPFGRQREDHDPRVVVLFSGQFIDRKGLDVLLDAFAMLAAEIPELELLLLGGDDSSPYLERVPDQFRSRVKAAGFIQSDDLPALFAQADIFVLPSRHDGWGVVVNEALGAGLPIIVSDRVGSARDLVEPGHNGLVFESENVAQLADCIRRLASSSDLRRSWGQASRALSERFGLDEGVRRWKSLCAWYVARKEQ